MSGSLFGFFANLLQIGVSLFVAGRTLRLIGPEKKISLPATFFLFAMVTLLLSDLYWLIHSLMRPGVRFVYSAAEISADGAFLLIAATLTALLGGFRRKPAGLLLAALLFMVCNSALWIHWTGEWFKDIFDGAIFGYLLCIVVLSIWNTEGLSLREWIGLGIVCGLLVAGEATGRLDSLCYAGLYMLILFFLWKIVSAIRRDAPYGRAFSLACGGYCWSLCTLYMSAEPIYFFSLICVTGMELLMYIALKKEENRL